MERDWSIGPSLGSSANVLAYAPKDEFFPELVGRGEWFVTDGSAGFVEDLDLRIQCCRSMPPTPPFSPSLRVPLVFERPRAGLSPYWWVLKLIESSRWLFLPRCTGITPRLVEL